MSQQPARICILGGGFGGLYTALRLSQLPWESEKPEIVLIDRSDRFLFSPLLYELLTGELQTWEIAPPFVELLASTGIRFCQGEAAEIDIYEQRVRLQDGIEIPYDRLVLALGGETPLDMVPGASSYAFPFRTLADAYRMEERLRLLEASTADKIRVAIVGGGYSGVELACKLADRLGERGRFRLVELSDQILRTSPEFNREAATKALEKRGIWLDLETKVESIEPNAIALEYKNQVDIIPVDIVVWTIGTRVAPIVRSLPLKQNQRGQLTATSTLQVIDRPEIFALGDLAECRDAAEQQVPGTAQAAVQQADYAAWNIWASLTHRPLLPFRYQNLGEMMTLGIDSATLTGLGIKLEGPLAAIARRLAYLYRLPTLDHQIKVGINWITRPFLQGLEES
ncbi:MAG: Demethylphylloquinone reductase NdbB [Chroococcidiopsis cubana SAG 39.79]|jgi:demethylphylloquinone reductase|uniref:demethylphylloquinone reductase n=2 Tax=Chroococcidiopsis TaxID=54298 RepID=K9U5S8_CHRTP|nr:MULTISPECIES: NAD(P)/FAD-dependent oxidoreductase [Chroococcidiopsis]PSB45631.1 NAD(P)/FAD-dependent oxidoreductase [Cyanosarcina cf. burmensis CCALA 770]AFY90452.1 FAD-dependent pyridine nucleotide-disulfide oxidoreductase [Chroococcidiopsis thermalis PCC 7203]MDZ4878463.1 Demethylphylloquinone reductase NdbB [Chroococcidiopsis cubana SAG 39.79]PSB65505.1 NAD(P)/FAD-dependent oxidoreductase [Chroococcidiopsis cubana CCALA 043]RUT11549.1 NADH dehydrogenase [Chroococcidiopsis cubana SAG 39.7